MATRLIQIAAFVAVGAGAAVPGTHSINVHGVAQIPDFIAVDNGSFTVTAVTSTGFTLTNNGLIVANCNVWLELKHSSQRAFGSAPMTLYPSLTPRPFIAAAGSGGSSGAGTLPEKWNQQNVVASQTNVALSALVSTNFDTIKAIRAGSIIGLSTRFTEAVTAGQITVSVTINGVAGTLNVVSTGASNTTGGQSTQLAGVDTYVAGDLIGVQLTTNAGFLPITTDLEAWLEVSE